MQKEIYVQPEEMHTIYCGAKFDRHKHVVLPSGFEATKYRNRLKTWEAERSSRGKLWAKFCRMAGRKSQMRR